MRTITVAVQNVRGLDQTKVHEILRNLKREKVDVGILVEYKIGKENTRGKRWEKNMFGKTRICISKNDSRNNGVLMIYSNSLAKSVRYKSLVDGYLSVIEVYLKSTKLYIMGIYNPCDHQNQIDQSVKEKIKEIIKNAATDNCPIFVMGDFNAVLAPEGRMSGKLNKRDQKMMKFIEECEMKIVSDSKITFFSGNSMSSIDHIIGKNFSRNIEILSVNICELTSQSDHLGRIIELRALENEGKAIQHNNHSVKKILKEPWRFNSLSELQGKFAKLNTCFKKEHIEHHCDNEELNDMIDQLQTVVDKRTKTKRDQEEEAGRLKSLEKELRKDIKKRSRKLNNESFMAFLEKIQKGNELLYRYGLPQKRPMKVIALKDGNRQLVNINDMLEYTSKHFTQTFKKKRIESNKKTIGKRLGCWQTKMLQNLSQKEFEAQLQRMNTKSATGWDGVNVEDLKMLFKERGREMTELFNREVKVGLASSLKRGILIPLHKKGDEEQISNYRPIVIGCMMSRLVMKVITERLMMFVIEKAVIPKRQLGFIKNRGATPGIQMLREFMTQGKLKDHKVVVTALDISNAYNNVNHELLIHILKEQQFPEDFVEFVRNWLRNQSFMVKIMGQLSESKDYEHGVPQGDPMSPLIFNLYVNGVLNCKEGMAVILMFADDVIVFGNRKTEIEKSIQKIVIELKELGMQLSPQKSEVMMVSWRNGVASLVKGSIQVDGMMIESKKTLKYLGLTFQIDGGWNKNIYKVQEKLKERVKSLRYNWLRLGSIRQLLTSVLVNGGMYYHLVGAFSEKSLMQVAKWMAGMVRRTLRLSGKTSKQVIFSEEKRGGLGVEWPHGYAYYNYIIHSVKALNSKIEELRQWSRSNLFGTIDELENKEGKKKDNEWKKFLDLLWKLNLELAMDDNGLFKIQGNDSIADPSESRAGVDMELEELKDHIHQKVRLILREERGAIEDDSIINQSTVTLWDIAQGPVSEKGMTRYEWSSLISVRSGVVMDDWNHPAFCERCKSGETLKHVFHLCRPKEEVTQLEEEIMMTFRQQLGHQKIQVRWEDDFDDQGYQVSPRAIMNNVMLKNVKKLKTNNEEIQKLQGICGRYIKKIRLENEYFQRKGRNQVGEGEDRE